MPRTSATIALALSAIISLSVIPASAQSGDLAQGSSSQSRPAASPPPAPAPRLTPRLRPRPVAPQPAQPTQPQAPAASPSRAPAQNSSTTVAPRLQPPPTASLPPGGFYPPLLPVYKDLDPPAGYVQKSSFNHSLLWSGGVLLAVSYGVSLIYSSGNSDKDGIGSLAIPVLGPWLALGQRKFKCEVNAISVTGLDDIETIQENAEEAQACWAEEVKVGAILTGLGVAQLVGTFMLTAGFIDQKRYWLRADLDTVSIRVDPLAGPEVAGFIASGSF